MLVIGVGRRSEEQGPVAEGGLNLMTRVTKSQWSSGNGEGEGMGICCG